MCQPLGRARLLPTAFLPDLHTVIEITYLLQIMPPKDFTGFDPKRLAASSGQPKNDPWARNEAWRYNGPFTRRARFSNTLPGFGIAAVAFAGYMVYEQLFLAKSHGHGDSHGDSHH